MGRLDCLLFLSPNEVHFVASRVRECDYFSTTGCLQVLDLLNKLEKNRTKSSSNGKIQDLDARTIAAWFKKYNEIIPRRAENIKSALKVQALQMEVALYRESLEKKPNHADGKRRVLSTRLSGMKKHKRPLSWRLVTKP
jgi:hypothetical protein